MKPITSVLAITVLAACSSVAKPDVSPCASLGLECSTSGNILIAGKSNDKAELLNIATKAAEKFETTFGRKAAKTVIVLGGSISTEQQHTFEAAGYSASLPWMSVSNTSKLKEANIRKQVLEQTKDFPESIRNKALQQALAKVGGGSGDDGLEQHKASTFAHELGHKWFIQAFKPSKGKVEKGHAYGGWAPDWLDETAAVLMENETLTNKRRKRFFELAPEEKIPLTEYLVMEHPAAKAALELVKQPKEKLLDPKTLNGRVGTRTKRESRIIMLSGKEAEAFIKKSGGNRTKNFYSQTQVFSDFLLSYNNDTQMYVSLTEALLEGGTIETWLATQTWGLPTSLAALDKAWLAWIDKDGG